MFNFIARLLRMATNCATVMVCSIVSVLVTLKSRKNLFVKASEDQFIKQAHQRKNRQERIQKQAEKRIAKMNDLLED